MKELMINDKMYEIVDTILYNSRKYAFLMNTKDNTDAMCLRVIEGQTFGLEKLDTNEELVEVANEFYKREKEELEN